MLSLFFFVTVVRSCPFLKRGEYPKLAGAVFKSAAVNKTRVGEEGFVSISGVLAYIPSFFFSYRGIDNHFHRFLHQ